MNLLEVLTIERFEEWLNEQYSFACIGIARKNDSCPVVTYLREQGFTNVVVTKEFIRCAVYPEDKFYLLELVGENYPAFYDDFTVVDYLPSWICHFMFKLILPEKL